jgi:heme/copper-type cytochrome/quinol oxidase subunit 3
MSGQNVIPLDPSRRAQSAVVTDRIIAMLVFVVFEAMMFAGMVSAFLLTRAATAGAWPPAGQPWFPPEETAINTAALLASGALVFLAARAWEKREARVGPLLLAAIALGSFFVFFQGVVWVALIRQGLALTSSQPGIFFCITVGMHGANALGALIFLGVVWLRLKPLREYEESRGSLSGSTFSVARILWYFVVGVWPLLYLILYL